MRRIPKDCQACELRSVDRCKKSNRSIKRMAATGTPCPLDQQRPAGLERLQEIPVSAQKQPGSLALVTCFFNPERYSNPLENYHQYREALGDLAKHLWVIELAFDDDPYQLPDGPQMIRVRGTRERHKLWQKERLLNLAAEHVPESYSAIGYSDCDLLYDEPGWYQQACHQLESSAAVQLFSQIVWLNKEQTGYVREPRESWAGSRSRESTRLAGRLAPGGAWAFKRSLWPIPDSHVLGGGDTLLLWSMRGRIDHTSLDTMSEQWQRHWAAEAVAIYQKTRAKISAVPGRVRHLYHGEMVNRQYQDRWQILRKSQYDPETDIETDPQTGLLQWTQYALMKKPEMVKGVADYFTQRDEDNEQR